MPLTVAAVENEVVTALRGKLAELGVSTDVTGANPDLRGPIRKALAYVGRAPLDPTAASDADFAGLAGWPVEQVYDAATLETLYVCLGQCVSVDETVGVNQQRLSQLSDQIQKMIAALESRLAKPYGPNVSRGAVGQMKGGSPMPVMSYRPVGRPLPTRFWPYPR